MHVPASHRHSLAACHHRLLTLMLLASFLLLAIYTPDGTVLLAAARQPVSPSSRTPMRRLTPVAKVELGPMTYTLSGYVRDSANNPVTGITITTNTHQSTTTDSTGLYNFIGLAAGTYTLMPSADETTFFPSSQIITLTTATSNVNFSTNTPSGSSISGQIVDVSGVAVGNTLVMDGSGDSAWTDANGYYTFTGLRAATYTITPYRQLTAGSFYAFSPPSYAVTVPGNGPGHNFIATAPMMLPAGKPVVVMVHGFEGTGGYNATCYIGNQLNVQHYPTPDTGTFGPMLQWLNNDGFDIWSAQLDTNSQATPSIEQNAACLAAQIQAIKTKTGAQKVTLIAHSMGGLVSRAYIEGSSYLKDVQALYTLGTPHGGTSTPMLVSETSVLGPLYCVSQIGGCEMSQVGMGFFNTAFSQRANGVPYYLIGGDRTPSVGIPLLALDDVNDGVVGAYSGAGYYHNLLPVPGQFFSTSRAVDGLLVSRMKVSETHSLNLGHSYFNAEMGDQYSLAYHCIRAHLKPGAGDTCTTWQPAIVSPHATLQTTPTLIARTDATQYAPGATATISATLLGKTGGIAGATLSTSVTQPDGTSISIALLDQGGGRYQGTYTVASAPGYAHLTVRAIGLDGGTPFVHQVDSLFVIASPAIKLDGRVAEHILATQGNGQADALLVDIGATAATAGQYTVSAQLVKNGQVVATATQIMPLGQGTQTMTLRFDGDAIKKSGVDGPYTVTGLLIGDLNYVNVVALQANNLLTTAAYKHTQFGNPAQAYLPFGVSHH